MQAIILAAGMGKRLGELTKGNTKCMVEVNGVKLIDRVICQLEKYNFSRIIIVIGYKGNELRNYLTDKYGDSVNIEYVENRIYDKTNNIYSLSLAKDKLIEDDTILLESDLIFEDEVLDKIIKHPESNLALVSKYQTWMDGTMVTIDEDNRIVSFIPKQAFKYSEINDYYKTVNIYKFSREFSANEYIPMLDAYSQVMGNNEYYEQVLRILSLIHDSKLKALPLENEKWYEIDDVQDLDIASAIFSEKEIKYDEYHKRYGGYWRFPEMLDYCYLVNPFFPPERMIEEMKSNFENLLRNYPSGQYVNSLLAAKYFGIKHDYTVVGNGAAELIKSFIEIKSPKKVGVVFPTFDEYPNRMTDIEIIQYIPDNPDYRYGFNDLKDFFGDKDIDLLLLINPDNPSGNFISKPDVIKLCEWCKSRGFELVVDESFVDFADCNESSTLLENEIMEEFNNLFIMKSISKSYGVPGLRLGILATSNRDVVRVMRKDISIWNINSFAEFYMQIYGKYEKDYRVACKKFVEERKRFFSKLQKIGYLHVMPSQANYFLCRITRTFTSRLLTQILLDHNVLISNCGRKRNMKGENLIRIAIRSKEDNDRLIDILKQLDNQYSTVQEVDNV